MNNIKIPLKLKSQTDLFKTSIGFGRSNEKESTYNNHDTEMEEDINIKINKNQSSIYMNTLKNKERTEIKSYDLNRIINNNYSNTINKYNSSSGSNLLSMPYRNSNTNYEKSEKVKTDFINKKDFISKISSNNKPNLNDIKFKFKSQLKENTIYKLTGKSIKMNSPVKFNEFMKDKILSPYKNKTLGKENDYINEEIIENIKLINNKDNISFYYTESIIEEIEKNKNKNKLDIEYIKEKSQKQIYEIKTEPSQLQKDKEREENEKIKQDRNLFYSECLIKGIDYLHNRNINIFEIDENTNEESVNLRSISEKILVEFDRMIEEFSKSEEIQYMFKGTLIFIYFIIKKYYVEIDDELKSILINKVLESLNSYNNYDDEVLYFLLEIVNCFEENESTTSSSDFFIWICYESSDFKIQQVSFDILMKSSIGFECILDSIISNENETSDKKRSNQQMLYMLINNEFFQEYIIIQSLINDIKIGDTIQKNKALKVLSKIKLNIQNENLIDSLIDCLFDERVNKLDLSLVFYNFNRKDKIELFLNQYSSKIDSKTKISLLSSLSKPIEVSPRLYEFYLLDNMLCDSSLVNLENYSDEYAYISKKNLLSCIRRIKRNGIENEIRKENNHILSSENILDLYNFYGLELITNKRYYELLKITKKEILNSKLKLYNVTNLNLNNGFRKDNKYFLLSKSSIMYIIKFKNDYDSLVRETVCECLSQKDIIINESLLCLKELLNDKDLNVRIKAIWGVSFYIQDMMLLKENNEITKEIYEIIKIILNIFDNEGRIYFKLRSACLMALTKVHKENPYFIEIIEKLFFIFNQKQSKNKDLLAEAIVSMGSIGESYFINQIANENHGNIPIKTIIINSFKFIDPYSQNLDFVLEMLYKNLKSKANEIREASFNTIIYIYLRQKNIINKTNRNQDQTKINTNNEYFFKSSINNEGAGEENQNISLYSSFQSQYLNDSLNNNESKSKEYYISEYLKEDILIDSSLSLLSDTNNIIYKNSVFFLSLLKGSIIKINNERKVLIMKNYDNQKACRRLCGIIDYYKLFGLKYILIIIDLFTIFYKQMISQTNEYNIILYKKTKECMIEVLLTIKNNINYLERNRNEYLIKSLIEVNEAISLCVISNKILIEYIKTNDKDLISTIQEYESSIELLNKNKNKE